MIIYSTVWQLQGSVFPSAARTAFPVAFIAATLSLLIQLNMLPNLDWLGIDGKIAEDNGAFASFSTLVGFLVIFRTSQAYQRFWDGCTATQMMRAEWFDACSSVLAFTRTSKAPAEDVRNFQLLITRLFSLIHAVAFAEIEDTNDFETTGAPNFEILDLQSIDDQSLMALKECEHKAELVFQWIQNIIVDAHEAKIVSAPPPIVSRAFHELASGMVHYHDAMKISMIPFPFPYAQTCDVLLLVHSFITPFAMATWISRPWWAFILCFTQVFIFWCLNYTATELQNPFGTDPNDIDAAMLQKDMNEQLTMIVSFDAMRVPTLRTQEEVKIEMPLPAWLGAHVIIPKEARAPDVASPEADCANQVMEDNCHGHEQRRSFAASAPRRASVQSMPNGKDGPADPWQAICSTRRSVSSGNLAGLEAKPTSRFSAFRMRSSVSDAAKMAPQNLLCRRPSHLAEDQFQYGQYSREGSRSGDLSSKSRSGELADLGHERQVSPSEVSATDFGQPQSREAVV